MALAIGAFMTLVLQTPLAEPGENGHAMPAGKDKCPVCGMFVTRYPDWTATAVFRDGIVVFFDGPKDLFIYLADLKRYDSRHSRDDIKALSVMDYYAVNPINGFAAFYVIGSDVHGPMGAELVPFQDPADAREFLKDHQGKRLLRFKEVTPDVLETLR
jgi:nitrous oxide reductase accessory protein NosL